MLCNIPEEGISHLNKGGNLKSGIKSVVGKMGEFCVKK
jgi:hypothetical protein